MSLPSCPPSGVRREAGRRLALTTTALLFGGACAALAGAGAPAPHKSPTPPWQHLSENELRDQLARLPELDLLRPEAGGGPAAGLARVARELEESRKQTSQRLDRFVDSLRRSRPDLSGLPFRKGKECVTDTVQAETLESVAGRVRVALRDAGATNSDFSRFWAVVADSTTAKVPKAEAIPALLQLLLVERQEVRLALVDYLRMQPGKAANVALAQRMVFDLDGAVRARALAALKGRPAADYTAVLLDALRYPWAPVAQRAAEALTTLKLKQTVPQLVAMLEESDPAGVFMQDVLEIPIPMTRDVVRVNHLRNCLLCHPASSGKSDLVRGRIPVPDVSLSTVPYYSGGGEFFVRADVTYLRQDFSVVQQVARPGVWPERQRYDYLVRTRPLTSPERRTWLARKQQGVTPPPSATRQALLFALRQLTGQDAGTTAPRWRQVVRAVEAARR